MKAPLLSILLAAAGCASAVAQNSASSLVREITQTGTQVDTAVGPNGSGQITATWPIVNQTTFQLWAESMSGTWVMPGALTVSPYTPTGNVSILTVDTMNSLRTREDIPYKVIFTVSMPASFSGATSADLNQLLYYQWFDHSGTQLGTQGPWSEPTQSNTTLSITPQTTYGTETWSLDSQAVSGVSGQLLSSATANVYPKHTGSAAPVQTGTFIGDPVTMPDTMVNLTNLYPDNQTLYRVNMPDGTQVQGALLTQSTGSPNVRAFNVPWSTLITQQGTYSLEVWTWTPVAGWEQIIGASTTTFAVQFSVSLGASVITTN